MPLPHWERCLPWIERSLAEEHHTETGADIFTLIAQGRAQFWPGADCAMVTEIATDDAGKFLNLWIVGGDLSEILALLPGAFAFARLWGCTEARFRPIRKGWARLLKPMGFLPDETGFVRKRL